MWIEIPIAGSSTSANEVTPFTGVWIEIIQKKVIYLVNRVTPFTGVWIEMIWFCIM